MAEFVFHKELGLAYDKNKTDAPPPEGYQRISHSCYSEILVECEHREFLPKSCCGNNILCKACNRKVSRLVCLKCKGNEQWIKDYMKA